MSATVLDIENNPLSVGVITDGKDTWLQTGSGQRVSILNPQESTISIEDIANAISKLCRYNGHVRDFYSVAQHSVVGAEIAQRIFGDDVAREFLLHDATEAYVGDMIRPVKVHDPLFLKIEDGFWQAIATKFSLPLEMTKECKYIDDVMCAWEKRDLLPNSEHWPSLPDISFFKFPKLRCWGWKKSRDTFLKEFGYRFGGDND